MKILSSDIVQTGHGQCDFCHKKDVNGVVGKMVIETRGLGELKKVIDDYENVFPAFSMCYRKIIGEVNIKFLAGELRKINVEPLICLDCIKEFSKIIK